MRETGTPLGMSVLHVEPFVPQRIPPAPTMVPPSGFVMVSLNVDTGAADSTASNVAPQVCGPAMVVRPVGAQSPVYPLHTYPLSGVLESSIGSPVVIMAEHFVPRLPHSMPGPLIVPPVGLLIVSSLARWPDPSDGCEQSPHQQRPNQDRSDGEQRSTGRRSSHHRSGGPRRLPGSAVAPLEPVAERLEPGAERKGGLRWPRGARPRFRLANDRWFGNGMRVRAGRRQRRERDARVRIGRAVPRIVAADHHRRLN